MKKLLHSVQREVPGQGVDAGVWDQVIQTYAMIGGVVNFLAMREDLHGLVQHEGGSAGFAGAPVVYVVCTQLVRYAYPQVPSTLSGLQMSQQYICDNTLTKCSRRSIDEQRSIAFQQTPLPHIFDHDDQ